MQVLKEINISKFKTTKSKNAIAIPLFQELREIKNGVYRDKVLECRSALATGDKNLYSSLKEKLPCVTFCGIFDGGHKASDIKYYNQLLILDIDNISQDRLTAVKEILCNDPHLLSLWKSPSGAGYKALFTTENTLEAHRATFDSIRVYFLEQYNIELDKSGSDVSRLCFSSWDEDIYYNPIAEQYNETLSLEEPSDVKVKGVLEKETLLLKNAFATEGLNKAKDRQIIKKIINYLTKKHLSITSSYDEWVRVALAISYTFSYDVGEKYFLQLSEMDGVRFDLMASRNLLRYCYNRRKGGNTNNVSFATLIYFANDKGFENQIKRAKKE
ncbi:BT4734/BF3469 family protein [Pedobacter sp. UBA5917]|jgi:hypothetical protein|uniref:BT4734/BF3469 family protein n=1 Tax=Pedobacter sp. UBA5917 TaxID=1947061 RepID=UPI0025E31EEB|nr:BT4734/BF3469 family protein [Pedobacter sp. UBA5917]